MAAEYVLQQLGSYLKYSGLSANPSVQWVARSLGVDGGDGRR